MEKKEMNEYEKEMLRLEKEKSKRTQWFIIGFVLFLFGLWLKSMA